jgi:hypothetical protein
MAILKHLRVEAKGVDIETPPVAVIRLVKEAKGVIVATPTPTHFPILRKLYNEGAKTPILCEKPLSTNMNQVKDIIEKFTHKMPLTMVKQYDYVEYTEPTFLSGIRFEDKTYRNYYNFYNTGKDGLKWDCIHFMRQKPENLLLKNDSPTWDCIIKGFRVDAESMHRAYIRMVKDWLEFPESEDYIDLLDAHELANSLEVKQDGENQYINWHPSKDQ